MVFFWAFFLVLNGYVEECAAWLCLFHLLCEKFFFFLVHVYVVPHRFWVFFNVFSFNFLRLHQYEHWQIDLPINGNIF
jgi:hypothetical protein